MLRSMFRSKKGQGLVEYGLIIAGVALMSAAALSIFGHKTSDLIAAVATVLPGAHSDDNAPIITGKLIETTDTAEGEVGGTATTGIQIDAAGIAGATGSRLSQNTGLVNAAEEGFGALILEAD